MPSVRIKTVIFDVDDVLCDYDRGARIAHMARSTGLQPGAIVTAIFESGFDDRADAGEYDAASYLAETNRRLGTTLTAAAWAAARKAGMTPRPAVLEMARRVGEKAALAALTNNGPLMYERIGDIFPDALALFGERLFFSSELGFAKPDPRAFLALVGRAICPRGRLLVLARDDADDAQRRFRETNALPNRAPQVNYLSAGSLTSLLKRNGFDIIKGRLF